MPATSFAQPQAQPEIRSLNPTQQYLLRVFSHNSPETLNDIEAWLLDYHRRRVDAEANRLWHELNLSEAKMEEILNAHSRTPYQ